MDILLIMLLLMAQAALATFVLLRAHDYRPARYFVALIAIFAILNAQGLFSRLLTNSDYIFIARAIVALSLGLFNLILLWLLSQLFMQQWWQGHRPILWISLPYIMMIIALTIDLVGHFGWFVDGLNKQGAPTLHTTETGGRILTGLFTVSWFVHVSMLIAAFIQHRDARHPIMLLFASLVFTLITTQINALIRFLPASQTGLITSIPILCALAYIVLRTSLLVPTRIALDLALQSLTDAVLVLDRTHTLVYVNAPGARLGFQENQVLSPQLNQLAMPEQITPILEQIAQGQQGEFPLTIGEKRLVYTIAPVIDRRAIQRGTLLIGRDITELERRSSELEQRTIEQQRLLDLVATLEAPTISLAEGVLFAPIVGYLDSKRAQTMTTRLLNATHASRTRAVILDITGVQTLDSSVAHTLLQMTVALRLLGCQVVISGVSAAMALTLVQQGNVLDGIMIVRSPQEALAQILS